MTDILAAWTLLHEGTHFFQGPRPDDSSETSFHREMEAFTAETNWLLEKQEWIHPEILGESAYQNVCKSFVQRVGALYVLNLEGIKEFVLRRYVNVDERKDYYRTRYAHQDTDEPAQRKMLIFG